MKKIILSYILSFISFFYFAQSVTGDALGTVIDSDTKQPMEFVKAIILDQGKNTKP